MQASPYLKTPVKIWLVIGLVMIFFQIIIGGITRLTGSGLSITKWDIVTGAIPPLNHDQWQDEFELYKRTPQYQKINQGMDLSRFKWIYFWEYLHRLWARSMGFVFLIPLVIFWLKGYLGVFACSFGGNVWMDYGCEWTGRKALGECIQIEHTSGFGIDHAEFFMVGIFEISICRQSLSG